MAALMEISAAARKLNSRKVEDDLFLPVDTCPNG
jgi:hypothetical protein